MATRRIARASSERPESAMQPSPLAQRLQRADYLVVRRGSRSRGCEQNHIPPWHGKPELGGTRAEDALRTIPLDRMTNTLGCSEGDPTRIAFGRCITYDHAHQRMVNAPSLNKHALEVPMGRNRPHTRSEKSLDGQALATLGTTASENGAAALRSHAGTETMRLGALTLVRLIGTFHWSYPPDAISNQYMHVSLKIVGNIVRKCQLRAGIPRQLITRHTALERKPAATRPKISTSCRSFQQAN